MIRFPFVRPKGGASSGGDEAENGAPEETEVARRNVARAPDPADGATTDADADAAEPMTPPVEAEDEAIRPAVAVRIEDAGFDLDKLDAEYSQPLEEGAAERAANGADAEADAGAFEMPPLEDAPTDAVVADPDLSELHIAGMAPDGPAAEGLDADPPLDASAAGPGAATGRASGTAPTEEAQARMVEAMLFASDKPLSTTELSERMPVGCDAAMAVRRVEAMYAGRGVTLVRVAGKWAFRTAPDLSHLMQVEAVESRRLSRAAVETLAIVAYNQPVTRAEIEEIRQVGVSRGTIDLLMELEWIKLGRRRQTPGRPVTFVTTEKFMEHFGLESIKDLPGLDELRQSGLLEARPSPGLPFGAGEDDDPDAYADEDEDEDDRDRQQDLMM